MTISRDCSVCGETKLQTEYPKNGRDKLGNTRYRTDCKECYAITRKLTKKKAVTKFLNNTKYRTGELNTYCLQDWKDAMLYFRGACSYCGAKQSRRLKLTRDHLVPVSAGGVTIKQNIIPACGRCNSSKANHLLETWYPKQKYFDSTRLEAIKVWTSRA